MQSISEFEKKNFPWISDVFPPLRVPLFYFYPYPYQVTVGSAWRMASESPQRTSPWKFHSRKSTYVATSLRRYVPGREWAEAQCVNTFFELNTAIISCQHMILAISIN